MSNIFLDIILYWAGEGFSRKKQPACARPLIRILPVGSETPSIRRYYRTLFSVVKWAGPAREMRDARHETRAVIPAPLLVIPAGVSDPIGVLLPLFGPLDRRQNSAIANRQSFILKDMTGLQAVDSRSFSGLSVHWTAGKIQCGNDGTLCRSRPTGTI